MEININNLFNKLENISETRAKINDKLAEMAIEGDAGGGLVRLIVNGQKEINDITIDDSLINEENKKMLCDLIIAASHVANKKVDEKVAALNMEASMDILPDLLK